MPSVTCAVCEKTLRQAQPTARYCSEACRQKAHRQRRAAEREQLLTTSAATDGIAGKVAAIMELVAGLEADTDALLWKRTRVPNILRMSALTFDTKDVAAANRALHRLHGVMKVMEAVLDERAIIHTLDKDEIHARSVEQEVAEVAEMRRAAAKVIESRRASGS